MLLYVRTSTGSDSDFLNLYISVCHLKMGRKPRGVRGLGLNKGSWIPEEDMKLVATNVRQFTCSESSLSCKG